MNKKEVYPRTFNKDNHIIGKVYDLNQKNMCLMLDYIDELKERLEVAELDIILMSNEMVEYRDSLYKIERNLKEAITEINAYNPLMDQFK